MLILRRFFLSLSAYERFVYLHTIDIDHVISYMLHRFMKFKYRSSHDGGCMVKHVMNQNKLCCMISDFTKRKRSRFEL